MKTLKNPGKILLVTLLFAFVINYSNAQDNTEEQLIQGTWTFSDSPNTKWQFKDDGKCYDYLDGILLDTYTYTIVEEKLANGKTGESVLSLVNTNNPDETYLYTIDKLNGGKLWLEYEVGFRDKYISFKRQEDEEPGELTAR